MAHIMHGARMYLAVLFGSHRTSQRLPEIGFCFGSFLCALFFKKVPTLRPHRAVEGSGLQEPRMYRWCQMMIREGGGRVG